MKKNKSSGKIKEKRWSNKFFNFSFRNTDPKQTIPTKIEPRLLARTVFWIDYCLVW